MPKGMSESLTTKISLGVVVLISFLFMGIIVYERMRIENSVEQKQQQLKVYKNQGLGLLNSEKNRLEKQLNSLHEADKAIVKIGDAVVTTQLQERRIAPATIAAVNSLVSIAPHANAAMDSASGTAEALTATAQSATETLAEGQRTIAAAQPLLKSYTQSGADLDALLKQKSITDTLANIDGTTRNFQDVTGDFAKVTHKASDDYLAPKPWYRKVGRYASDAFDFGALVARHY